MSNEQQTTDTTNAHLTSAHNQLRTTAVESVAYVAYGKVMIREHAEKFGITEDEASRELHRAATSLMDKIRELTL